MYISKGVYAVAFFLLDFIYMYSVNGDVKTSGCFTLC